jgi:hypothetical protein
MKKVLLLFAIIFPSILMAQDSTKKVSISEGTVVSLKILQDISSKSANVGDILEFETNEPIIIGDKVIIPIGTKAFGKVTEAAPRKMAGKAGKLNFTISYLNLANGKVIKLSNEQKANGKNKAGAAVAEAVLLTPLFLLKKGKDVKFTKGQIFKAFVERDYEM